MQEDKIEPRPLELKPYSVALNAPDVEELDALAHERQSNRSQLVRAALQDYLQSDKAAKARRFRPVR